MFFQTNKPLLLHYYLTTACQCKCAFCDIFSKPSEAARIDDVIVNLKAARRLGAKFVDFTGGEPLLYRALPEILKVAKKIGFITSVTTNGILLAERANELSGLIDLPRVSIDGGLNTHDKIRGVLCYERVIEGLEACKKHKIKTDIMFTLCKENQSEIANVYNIAIKYRAELILNPVFEYFNNNDFRTFDRILEQWAKRKHVYVNKAFIKLRKAGGNNIDKPLCRVVNAVIVINPQDELVLPCYHKPLKKIAINNSLETIWMGDETRLIRENQGKYEGCRGCTINCYMDPSFCYKLDSYFILSMLSKGKYAIEKYLLKYSH